MLNNYEKTLRERKKGGKRKSEISEKEIDWSEVEMEVDRELEKDSQKVSKESVMKRYAMGV